VVEDGRIIGVLNVESPEKDAFSKYDEYMLSVIASNASLWTRIYKSKSILALEKMATVGNVASHLIHTLNNNLISINDIADRVDEISAAADAAVRDRLVEQTRSLREVAPSVLNSIGKLNDMYKRALEPNQSVNVNDEARKVVRELVTREDITVRWDLDPEMPTLHISGGIYHIFWNLISNARQAIPDTRAGEIAVGTRVVYGQYTRQMEGFEMYVSDTGVGVPPDKLERIFMLDYSSKSGRRTGYGLWWVDTFVTRWGGKIYVESEVGKGTTVRIWFPLTHEGVAPPM
jgi:signal transduction histidine kinase